MVAVLAPSAQAADLKADFFRVTGVAAGSTSAVGTPDGQMLLTASCSTSDPASTYFPAYIFKCWVGPLRADTNCGWECFGPPAATVTGLVPQGQYEFCVGAGSIGATSKSFHQCAPLDPVTNTAVIRR